MNSHIPSKARAVPPAESIFARESEDENFVDPEGTDVESGSGRSEESKDIRESIIRKEERAVQQAKCFVAFSVMACAVAVFVAVYFLTKKSDDRSFEIEVCSRTQHSR